MLELGIQHVKSSAYHPFDPGGNWDESVHFVAVRNQRVCVGIFGISDLNYIIQTPDRRKQRQLRHINILKPYFDKDSVFHLILLILCILHHLKKLIIKFKLRMNIL